MRQAFVMAVFALSGAASALAFPPYDMAWLVWAAAAPALVAAVSVPLGHALFGGFLFGMAQALVLLPWFFRIWGPGALALHVIYAVFFALIFAFVRAAAERYGTHALLWAAPPIWVGVEFFRSECWAIKFAWFGLGYSQHDNVPLLQIASVGGVYLLSLLLAGANGALAWFLERPSRRRFAAVLAAGAVVAMAHLPGTAVPAERGEYRVVGVEGERKSLDHFFRRTEEALRAHPAARLVVWPEFAMTHQLDEGHPYLVRVGEFAREHGVHVLFGATRARGDDFENTLFLVRPNGSLGGTQVKSVPVPFMKDGLPAKDRAPMKLGEGPVIGAATCYDMDFTFVSRELVREGADLLVFPTMDLRGWGDTQHRQHFAMATLRAVEHRRWVVRLASSGISCVVDPYGRVTAATGIGQTEMRAEVRPRSDRTFYTSCGYWLPHACLLAALLILGGAVVKSRSGSSPASS